MGSVYMKWHCEMGAFSAPVGATSCLKSCFCFLKYCLAQPLLLPQVIFSLKDEVFSSFPMVCLSCNDPQFLKHRHGPWRKFNHASLKIRGKKLADGIHDLCLTCRHKQKLRKFFGETAPTAKLALKHLALSVFPRSPRRSGELLTALHTSTLQGNNIPSELRSPNISFFSFPLYYYQIYRAPCK